MKRLMENRGLRVLAFVLCLLFLGGAAGFGVCYAYDFFELGMTGERDFTGSEFARMYVNSNVWNALHTVYFASRQEGETPVIPDPDEGYACVIYGPEGRIVADTRTENSRRVTAHGSWELNGYTAESYVNLPAEKGTALYNAVAIYDFLYNGRNAFLPLTIVLGVLGLLLFVFLMAAAGRTAEGVRLGGLHRWPLELYLGALIAAGAFFAWGVLWLGNSATLYDVFLIGAGMGACLMGVGAAALLACMTLAARFRAGRWWRNTVIFFVLRLCWRVLRWCARTVKRVVLAIPVAWKAGLVFCAVALVNVLGMAAAVTARFSGSFWLLALFLADLAGLGAALLAGAQLKKLQAAGRALAAGDLSYTVDTSRLWLDLKEHGENLNAVSLGMSRAVNERMRSERFKTELITNVSHDLKTPLTSIVNYVDLLKKEKIEGEQAREYIDVLDRQSQRLKKLTADLVDASKASSGALPVNLERLDLKELLRQSAGEYAERFALAGVEPVLNLPEEECVVCADGRLLWRVLDNLFLNVTKYAQSGTRFYMDAVHTPAGTELALKNISRQALNIPADELMERFVRGDSARSTEGSGLGLSIARSLMELMGGALRLTLDGDLFKATLLFPRES